MKARFCKGAMFILVAKVAEKQMFNQASQLQTLPQSWNHTGIMSKKALCPY